MEDRSGDDALEDYFFSIALQKESIYDSLLQISGIILEEGNLAEDAVRHGHAAENPDHSIGIDFLDIGNSFTKSVDFAPVVRSLFSGRYEGLKGLDAHDKAIIGKLFFGKDFSGIQELESYLDTLSRNVGDFRKMDLLGRGVVFHVIFSVIEQLFDIDDADFMIFLMNERKEVIEAELLAILRETLRTFKENALYLLRGFQSVKERILGSIDDLSETDLQLFEQGIEEIAQKTIDAFGKSQRIEENLAAFTRMRENFRRMRKLGAPETEEA